MLDGDPLLLRQIPRRMGEAYSQSPAARVARDLAAAIGVAGPVRKAAAAHALIEEYRRIRAETERLAAPLSAEDQTVQSMPDASPVKWHRAHTTWFFETFLLLPHLADYVPFDPAYSYLFNSYYEAVGPRHPRPARGVISRPGIAEIAAYRAHVDAAMERLLAVGGPEVAACVQLGLQHEQQHQELLLTDIKHAFSCSALLPPYAKTPALPMNKPVGLAPIQWLKLQGGLYEIGRRRPEECDAFAFDNETPQHEVLLRDFAIADRPVSNGEYLEFMQEGGYRRSEFWLSEGWALVQAEGWQAPAYWQRRGPDWRVFTLQGLQPVTENEPVCHVSYFEAAAYAAWAGRRLPTEFEWEVAAQKLTGRRLPREAVALHPGTLKSGMDQDVWEWTASAYSPYPGFRADPGALGEYNGKFMVNQMVLRGRSCVTPPGHERPSYRNFFPPQARWQFSGIRLVEAA